VKFSFREVWKVNFSLRKSLEVFPAGKVVSASWEFGAVGVLLLLLNRSWAFKVATRC